MDRDLAVCDIADNKVLNTWFVFAFNQPATIVVCEMKEPTFALSIYSNPIESSRHKLLSIVLNGFNCFHTFGAPF